MTLQQRESEVKNASAPPLSTRYFYPRPPMANASLVQYSQIWASLEFEKLLNSRLVAWLLGCLVGICPPRAAAGFIRKISIVRAAFPLFVISRKCLFTRKRELSSILCLAIPRPSPHPHSTTAGCTGIRST